MQLVMTSFVVASQGLLGMAAIGSTPAEKSWHGVPDSQHASRTHRKATLRCRAARTAVCKNAALPQVSCSGHVMSCDAACCACNWQECWGPGACAQGTPCHVLRRAVPFR